MNKEILNNACTEIDNFEEKLGKTFFEAIMEQDNTTYEIAKSIVVAFNNCNSQEEFEAANNMLIAISGYGFETLIERIKEQDKKDYIGERDDL